MHARTPVIALLSSVTLSVTAWTQAAPRLPDLASLAARSGASARAVVSDATDGNCTPDWLPTFGATAGTDGLVSRGLAFDDGSGPALVVVGAFSVVGSQDARHVARWDGAQWSPMGDGLEVPGRALTVHDDGSGPALYAGGDSGFSNQPSLARWDGAAWTDVPFPGTGSISALASYDDSSGPALYAGGDFSLMGGPPVRLVRFDGTTWSTVPGALLPGVADLAVHTEAGVTSLYVAFNGVAVVGGQTSQGALRWSSTGWSRILGQPVRSASALAVHDDGSGPTLYIGGNPASSEERALSRLVNGGWVEVAATVTGTLRDLISADLGAGPRLLVALEPHFPQPGGPVVQELVGGVLSTIVTNRVDGALGLRCLVGFDRGAGTELVLLGLFDTAGGLNLDNVARVDGDVWRALGGNPDVQGPIQLATAFGSGAARRWVTVRKRADATGVVRPFVDAWDGSGWASLGEVSGPVTPTVTMLQVLTDGNGERLYAGGRFNSIGGVAANGIAVHDGIGWSALGGGLDGPALCAALFDGGQGQVLVVGGDFWNAGGVAARGVASFDGATWGTLGGSLSGRAEALVVDASGPTQTLYVGGEFTTAGALTCNSIARWSGAAWTPLGAGFMNFVFPGTVYDLALFDEGQGPRLFAVGAFEVPGSFIHLSLARFNGTSWSDVGGASASGRELLVHDDGTGRAIYLAGSVEIVGGSQVGQGVVRWDGAAWEALPGAPIVDVHSLSVFDAGDGRALMCAGSFRQSPTGDAYVTRWRGCPAQVGELYCAPAVTNSTGVGATLSAVGSVTVAESDVRLIAADLPLGSFGVFLASRTRDLFPGYNGSQGALCLGGAVGLFSRPGEVQNSGAVGAIELALDVTSLPTSMGAVPAVPGETWHFQAWYRDRATLGATSNFTPGVSVAFE